MNTDSCNNVYNYLYYMESVAWISDLYGMNTNTKKSKRGTESSFMRPFPHLMIQTDTKPQTHRGMKIGGFG